MLVGNLWFSELDKSFHKAFTNSYKTILIGSYTELDRYLKNIRNFELEFL